MCVVDDDEADRLFAERALRRAGVQNPVRSFASGKMLMTFLLGLVAETVDEHPIPVCAVFVDLKMPAPDGFEVLCWIRAQRELAHIQVVVLSGSIDPKDMRRSAELRADLYLPKFPSDGTLARVVTNATDATRQLLRVALAAHPAERA